VGVRPGKKSDYLPETPAAKTATAKSAVGPSKPAPARKEAR
jgi:hypothetical protein